MSLKDVSIAQIGSTETVDLRARGGDELDELLTVDEVAALLKVSRSWVYEHTRTRQPHRGERLPSVKLGKYVRFEPRAVQAFLARRRKLA